MGSAIARHPKFFAYYRRSSVEIPSYAYRDNEYQQSDVRVQNFTVSHSLTC
jgi:hypothetical protein